MSLWKQVDATERPFAVQGCILTTVRPQDDLGCLRPVAGMLVRVEGVCEDARPQGRSGDRRRVQLPMVV